MAKKINNETIESATFISLILPFILEKLDQIEQDPTIYKYRFKKTLKDFKIELEKIVDIIYKGSSREEADQGINASNVIAEKLEELFESYVKEIRKGRL